MAFEATNLRLFGLDLSRVGDSVRIGLEGMARWPFFARFAPVQRVHVLRPDGSAAVCNGASFDVIDAAPNARADLRAVVLPGEIVLTHALRLPSLSRRDLDAAVELQLQTLSPLPLDQIHWGWRIDVVHDEALDVTVVFAPRTHVASFLERSGLVGQGEMIEIWADVSGPVVLHGFGETRRQARSRRHWMRMGGLVLLVLILLASLPVMHFLQVRAQVFDAQRQFALLQQSAAPFVASRDAVIGANARAVAIDAYMKTRLNVPWLVDTLTEALPDSAWVFRLDVEGRRVRITGQAADAARLMEVLRSRREFSELRALSPIARGRDGLDSFHFEFLVLAEEAWR